MKFDAQKALIAYSGALTAVVIGVMVSGAALGIGPASFTEIDVQRINVREADGTLRMVISNEGSFPGIPVRGGEVPHPSRDGRAGMLFMNDEGTELGGLIFAGKQENGVKSSGGSLTFDGYEQDQTIQLLGIQEGRTRISGLMVSDRPDESIDFDLMSRMATMTPEEQEEASKHPSFQGAQRAFVGRNPGGDSTLVLRDAAGKARLVLSVARDGKARIAFMDDKGQVTREVTPDAG